MKRNLTKSGWQTWRYLKQNLDILDEDFKDVIADICEMEAKFRNDGHLLEKLKLELETRSQI